MDFSFDFIHDLSRGFGVVYFMILFVGIVFWAYRPKNRKKFEEHGNIPFKED